MALAAWALLGLQDAKEYLGLGSGTEEDAAVEDLIEAATQVCEDEQVTDRLLKSRAYADEVFDGSGGTTMRLRQYPITAVSAVSYWNGTSWEAQALTDLIIVGGLADRISLRGAFPRGFQNVKVSYTAGYIVVPAKIRQACREALMLLYKQRDKQLAGIASQSFPGGQTVTYRNDHAIAEARKALAGYARSTC